MFAQVSIQLGVDPHGLTEHVLAQGAAGRSWKPFHTVTAGDK